MSHLSYTQNFFIYFVVIVAVLLVSLNFIFAIHAPYKEKKTPFECGYHSFLQNRIQFVISFFVFALLFLLFDLEIVLIYPFSVSIDVNLIYGLILMVIFAITVTIGFVFEFGKKALTIDSRQFILQESTLSFDSLLWVTEVNLDHYTKLGRMLTESMTAISDGTKQIDLDFKILVQTRQLYSIFINELMSIAQHPPLEEGMRQTRLINGLVDSLIALTYNEQGSFVQNVSENLQNEVVEVLEEYHEIRQFNWSGVIAGKLIPALTQGGRSVAELLADPSTSTIQELGLEVPSFSESNASSSVLPSTEEGSSAASASSASNIPSTPSASATVPSMLPSAQAPPAPASAPAPDPGSEAITPPEWASEIRSPTTFAPGLGRSSSHSSLVEAATGHKISPRGGSPSSP